MKKLIFLCILLPFVSCNDDDVTLNKSASEIPVGTIVADVDGIETTFNVDSQAFAELIDWDFQQTALKISILGYNSSEKSKNILLWFFVVPVREINAGDYPDLDKQIYHFLEFNDMFRGEILNWGSNRYVEDYNSTSTITRIDSLIQGKFQGIVAIGTGPSTEGSEPPLTYKMENGLFNVKLKDWNKNRTVNKGYSK